MSALKETVVWLFLIGMLITTGINGAKLAKLFFPAWQTNSSPPIEAGFGIAGIFPR
jgi:hypothetical protein